MISKEESLIFYLSKTRDQKAAEHFFKNQIATTGVLFNVINE
ncbi:hypothetical protein SZ39_5595 [Bacillus mycoides]|nr:hypothetical protein SZ39_5595 [Bacillus mycoides]